jgi:hypothetical protein
MQPPQALANGASQGPKHSADEQNDPSAYVFSLTLLPTAKRFSPMVIYRDSFCRPSKPRLREITAGLAILEKLVKWKADPSTGGLHLLIVFCGRR